MNDLASDLRLTVVICTRDRGASICATLDSALAADSKLREVIVVDQSRSVETCAAVAPYLCDPRMTLIRSDKAGLSNARNLALHRAATDLVLMTDDDCVLPADYAARALQVSARYPDAGAVYLRVEAAPFDKALGFTPVFLPDTDRILNNVADLKQASGIGAGLLLRRTIVESIGGFDSYLGAGGPFNSAEDVDLTIRLLLAGRQVAETGDIAVVHHGFRPTHELRKLVRRDWFGIGAAYAKPMRTKLWRAFAPVLIADLFVRSIGPLSRNLLRLRPYGFASFRSFLSGYAAGLRQPLDADTLLYLDKAA